MVFWNFLHGIERHLLCFIGHCDVSLTTLTEKVTVMLNPQREFQTSKLEVLVSQAKKLIDFSNPQT
jgi:hypothetical protein